jgi:hypothetical protein
VDDADFTEQRDELLQSIEQHGEDVRVALHELTGAAEQKLVVAERIRAAPVAWLFGGFLLGIWLGSRGTSGPSAGPGRIQ